MAHVMISISDDLMRCYIANKLKKAGHAVTRVDNFETSAAILCEAAYDVLMVSATEVLEQEPTFLHQVHAIDPEMRIAVLNGFSAEFLAAADHQNETGQNSVHLNYFAQEISRRVAA